MAMSLRVTVGAAILCVAAGTARAQSAADHIALGDREHTAMNAPAALKHYEAALAVDSTSYEANWKAAREAVDAGEFNPSADTRAQLYRDAEHFARRAVAANPGDAEGHFHLARAIGRNALTMGSRDRIKYAKVVRNEALEALKIAPKHPGALHVMGVWNAEVMRLSGFTRMIAKNFLGGAVFGQANWQNARQYLEQAVAVEPERLVHHLDLADVYRDTHDVTKAREQYELVIRGAPTEYNDPNYKREAEQRVRDMPKGM